MTRHEESGTNAVQAPSGPDWAALVRIREAARHEVGRGWYAVNHAARLFPPDAPTADLYAVLAYVVRRARPRIVTYREHPEARTLRKADTSLVRMTWENEERSAPGARSEQQYHLERPQVKLVAHLMFPESAPLSEQAERLGLQPVGARLTVPVLVEQSPYLCRIARPDKQHLAPHG